MEISDVLFLFAFLAGTYFLVRNELVYRFRILLIRTDPAAYDRLPTYDDMMLRFWVWPLRRFLPKEP
jgi:hypothetical protein